MGAEEGAKHFLDSFSDPAMVAHYSDGPRRFLPGLDGLHTMTGILLAEQAPQDAQVLVLGAGGGLELKALADAQPGWSFTGVDPAGAMLRLAEKAVGADIARVELVEGYIDDAPMGPFDAATCLLTLHFLDAGERLRTLREIRRRMKPGAPFVAAHGSYPQAQKDIWLSRYAAFAKASGVDPEQADMARQAVAAHVSMLDPEQDEAILREAGFSDVTLFYSAFTWRGWVCYA